MAGKLILVGSSMGGWISLLVAREMPERIAGLVTIAAAPDFTEDSMWAGFSDAPKGGTGGRAGCFAVRLWRALHHYQAVD